MIKSIKYIKDIGRFANFSTPSKFPAFSDINLIYSDNGGGKSTLASIFKSLEGNSPRFIMKHARLPISKSKPQVILELENGKNLKFNYKKGWDLNDLSLAVYDSSFINDNVYSGNAIFREQRERLFSLLFANEEGKEIFKELEVIDISLSGVNKKLSECIAHLSLSPGKTKKMFLSSDPDNLASIVTNKDQKEILEQAKKLLNEKKSLIESIKIKKEKLITIIDDELTVHQASINYYLSKFGTNFKVMKLGSSNFSSDLSKRLKYSIGMNDFEVDIFASNTIQHGLPYFDTLLSDADKRAISLAFFLSKLDASKNVEKTIVVFDDPMSSFDESRRYATKEIIKALKKKTRQIFILSHDAKFLHLLKSDKSLSSAQQYSISKNFDKNTSSISLWNEKIVESNYFAKIKLLHSFVSGECNDKLHEVLPAMRIVLEEYLKTRFPIDFKNGIMLGAMLDEINESDGTKNYFSMKKHIEELYDLKDFGNAQHHGGEVSNDIEQAKSYVKRTLKFIYS